MFVLFTKRLRHEAWKDYPPASSWGLTFELTGLRRQAP
jgi:hypothetical protein